MEDVNLEVLKACSELILRQNEILPFIAEKFGVEIREVFYEWAYRKTKQSGTILNGEWEYFFHGLECDVENLLDRRFVRIDFGPKGATDTFTGWGVLQFIMTSILPWTDYEELKIYLAKENPPYNKLSGSFPKMNEIIERLFNAGLIEEADKDLINFRERHTTIQANGTTLVNFPDGTSEKQIFDCLVAHRYKISKKGELCK